MKKLKLKLEGKEMLSKEQMKKISGGYCVVHVAAQYGPDFDELWACCNDDGCSETSDPQKTCKYGGIGYGSCIGQY